MRIILLGAPGAGKGTIASVLVQRTGAAHISTGDMLRAQLKEASPLSAQLRSYMEKGELVPDELVIAMLERRLEAPDAKIGFILDGFPRTLAQADMLEGFLQDKSQSLEAVFELKVPEEVIIRRLSGRRICPNCETVYNIDTMPPQKEGKCDRCVTEIVQREDDRPEAIAVRFRAYREQTEPLLGYYRSRGLLYSIDAGAGAIQAADQILDILARGREAAAANR